MRTDTGKGSAWLQEILTGTKLAADGRPGAMTWCVYCTVCVYVFLGAQ